MVSVSLLQAKHKIINLFLWVTLKLHLAQYSYIALSIEYATEMQTVSGLLVLRGGRPTDFPLYLQPEAFIQASLTILFLTC